MKNIHIVYHNDLDGRAAGALLFNYYNSKNKEDIINTYEADYRKFPLNVDMIDEDDIVYCVDYSFTENTVESFIEICKKCRTVWLDHHKSSEDILNSKYGDQIRNYCYRYRISQGNTKSGAMLTYLYIYKPSDPDEVPLYIRLIDDYDRFVYNYNSLTDNFKLGMDSDDTSIDSIVWVNLENDYLMKHEMFPTFLNGIIEQGKIISKFVETQDNFYRNNFAFESTIQGHKCLVINKKGNSKMFGEEFDKYPCVVSVVFDGTLYNYSIFSTKTSDVDCEEIARFYGGGGHKHAAGFTCKNLIVTKF